MEHLINRVRWETFSYFRELGKFASVVSKDLILKAKAKDSTFKAKAKAKDLALNAKAKDLTFKAKAKNLTFNLLQLTAEFGKLSHKIGKELATENCTCS